MPASTDPCEALPIIDYIVAEMNRNAVGDDARRMRELNSFSAGACIDDWYRRLLSWKVLAAQGPLSCVTLDMSYGSAAIVLWSLRVGPGMAWDHKSEIRRKFNAANPGGEQHWHRLGAFVYSYDIWSNIHYGYVGRACGFSESTLLNGAGAEQAVADSLRGQSPRSQPGVGGMAGFDHESDRAAVRIGIDLYRTARTSVTARQVRLAVESAFGLDKRPVQTTQVPS